MRSRSSSTTGSSVPPRRAARSLRALQARRADAAAEARRAPLLPPPSVPGASGALRLPARRNLCVRSLRRAAALVGRSSPATDAGDRRGARRRRTFTRLYGSPARRLLAVPADRVAQYAVRHADATRAVSTFTARLVEEVRGRLRAPSSPLSATSAFADRPPVPLPTRPTLLFVAARGLQEHRRPGSSLRLLADRVPEARLVVVGRGSRKPVVELLVADHPGRVDHHEWLVPDEVAAALDDATALVLPSWPEGLARRTRRSPAAVPWWRPMRAESPTSSRTASRGCSSPGGRDSARSCACPRRSGPRRSARRRSTGAVRRVALHARVPRRGDAEPGGRSRRGHRPIVVRLVLVTQTLDAGHPVLAQTLDLVEALAARSDELSVLCASEGRHGDLPPNVRVRVFGRALDLAAARFVWAIAAELSRRPRPDAVLAHMVPSWSSRRSSRGRSESGSLSGTRTGGGQDAQDRDTPRGHGPERRRARSCCPRPRYGDRPRDRRRAVQPVRSAVGRASAPARPGPHGALEGVRDDARGGGAGSRVRSRRGARAARPAADRGRARAPG